MDLDLPAHLTDHDRSVISALARRNLDAHGDDFLGLVLSGSVGRSMRTEHSDLDVYVVLRSLGDRRTQKSPTVDEIR